MSTERFVTKSGKVLTDADIQALADEAERGYDISKCPTCGGAGRVTAYGEEYAGETVACGTTLCPRCRGRGVVLGESGVTP